MSADHKRPLYAFTVVALLCALFVGNALRSEAMVSMLRAVETTVASAPDVVRGFAEPAEQPAEEPKAAGEPSQGSTTSTRKAAVGTAAVAVRAGEKKARSATPGELEPVAPDAGTPTEAEDVPADVVTAVQTPRAVTPRAVTPRVVTPRAVTPRAVTPRQVTRAVTPRVGRTAERPQAREERGRRTVTAATRRAERWAAATRRPTSQGRTGTSVVTSPRAVVPQAPTSRTTRKTVTPRLAVRYGTGTTARQNPKATAAARVQHGDHGRGRSHR